MIRSKMSFLRRQLRATVLCLFVLPVFSFAQNSIVTENSNAGNPISEWGVPDFRDNRIAGFSTKMSLNSGETVRFKINVQGAAAYTLKIYRLGYYAGNGARLMADLGTLTGIVQASGVSDPATGSLDCANWSESATWAIPVSAVSGFYIAKIERIGGGSNHIAFIVRNDASHSDLYLQFPDATWQAYNGYGGNSMYDGNTSFPSGHAVKVSYNRPFFPYNSLFNTDGRQADWYMNATYPMIRWLERNGYDITYTSCNDVARNGSRLLNHKIFISVGHDEYFSKDQRNNIEAARNAGVHLAFFTGNEVYWKTRWESYNGDEDRTLVCYKEGLMADGSLGERVCGSKCDPSPEWTGLWRTGGNYDAGKPENGLVGQISWVEYPTEIAVPSSYKKLRFWRNSAVANLTTGQTAALGSNTLGYEWDYEQPAMASSNPQGRITMSSKTINSLTHKLSLYRHSSGALVFGAGTVQWSWGLDGQHWGGNTTVSPDMQQATVNLFADMNAQPGSLQSGLVQTTISTDLTAPTASITLPSNGSTFSSGAAITFSGVANDAGGGVVAAVEISLNGGTTWQQATFNSADASISWSYAWTATTDGTFNIKVRGVDDSGNIGNAGTGITITVGAGGDVTPPTVVSTSPVSGATGVTVGTTITATLSEALSGASVTASSFQLRDAGNNIVSATVSTSSNQITLTPASALTISTTYTVTIVGGASGVKDVAGNPLANSYNWSFTTANTAAQPPVTIQNVDTKSGVGATTHALTGVPAGALLVLATTADAVPSDCLVTSTPSLTWTKRSDAGATSSDNAEIWTAVYAAGGTISVKSNWGGDHSQASVCYVVLNAEASLGGASAIGLLQSAPSVTINTTRDNSIIFGCTADFNARNGATRTLRDGATERLYFRDGNYTTYHYSKAATTTAAYTEGISLPTGQQSSTALLEIRGAVSVADIIPPTVSSVSPVDGSTGAGTNTTIIANFSESINGSTVTATSFQLKDAGNNVIAATISTAGGQVTLTPSAILANSAVYTVSITGGASGVKDLAGNALANNYTWSFTTAAIVDNTPPTVSSVLPAINATGTSINTTVTANFSEAVNASTVTGSTFQLRDAGNNLIGATLSTSLGQITLTPSAVLANSVVYSVTITGGAAGVKDLAGNALANNYTWSFTTVAAADNIPPTVSLVSPANAATGVNTNTTITATFNEAMNASTVTGSTFQLRDAGSNLIGGTLNISAAQITLTPTAALTASTTYTVSITGGISGVKDLAGNALANNYNWSFTTAAPVNQGGTTHTLFLATDAPIVPLAHDGQGIELGMRFRANQDGYINGIRYYKGSGTTGLHIGSLWSNSGTRLAQATFSTETASGWQEILFSSPVAITAGITYVASYFSPSGDYSATKPFFTQNIINGPLTGLADGTDGGNGLYRYTAASAFPNSTFQSSNYWVDVVFAPFSDNTAPTVLTVSPANAVTGVSTAATVIANFSEAVNSSTVNSTTVQLKDAGNNLVAATISTIGSQVTLVPTVALTGSTVYTVTITGGLSGIKDAAGNALANDYVWSFTTAVPDVTAPTVSSVTPVNGAAGVGVGSTVTTTFSEAVNTATVTSATFQLRNPSGILSPATISVAGNQIVLTPTVALTGSTVYTATITGGAAGVKDLAGNPLAADYTWSFTTAVVVVQPPVTVQSADTKTGTTLTTHSLTGIPAGALLVLATTADVAVSNCIVSSSPALTWTKRSDAGATNSDNAEIWTAVYAAGGAITVTSNWGGGHSQASVCYVVLNAEPTLGGASATAVSQSAPSVAITTTRENSIIFGCTADFNAVNGATRTLRDAATERLYFRDGNYTTYHYSKAATTIGAYTEGISIPAGQQSSTALLEIRGAGTVASRSTNTVSSAIAPVVTSIVPVYNHGLGQNYPNPFHITTNIPFTLSKTEKVNLVLFDINGRTVKVLLNTSKDAGIHAFNFNGGSLSKGIYYYKIQAGNFSDVKKLIIW